MEEEAKRKADLAVENVDDSSQQDTQNDSDMDSQQDDDVFYDSDGNDEEEE
jgi:hypothetical protein